MLGFLYRWADRMRNRARIRRWAPDQANGRRGEDIAHRYLQRAGLIVVARNYRMATGAGEIDLVGWEKNRLIFIEVKTRQTNEYGPPDRAIGPDKKAKLLRAAREYVRHAEIPWENVRFDIVNVVLGTPPQVVHVRDAFSTRAA